jgi:hypothetical protein
MCAVISPTAWVVDHTGFPMDGRWSVGVLVAWRAAHPGLMETGEASGDGPFSEFRAFQIVSPRPLVSHPFYQGSRLF